MTPVHAAEHRHHDRIIPSGFFKQPNSEYVSGVLFSNAATVSQFQRIAIEHGFDVPGIRVLRVGTCCNHDPDADTPKSFTYEVAPGEHRETFAQGLILFRNPVAQHPIPSGFFRDLSEGRLTQGGLLAVNAPPFTPLGSVAQIFTIANK